MRPAALILMAITVLAGSDALASGQSHMIKPSDVQVPAGTTMGQYQRITRPFGGWTLVCDENLESRTSVCNITQIVIDAGGTMAFNWSLAGTEAGTPMMIVRVAAPLMGNRVTLSLPDGSPDRTVTVECNETLCAGLMPLDRAFEDAIRTSLVARATYTSASGRITTLDLPLQGLAQAVSALP